MTGWQGDKMTRCQDDKVTGLQDEKMTSQKMKGDKFKGWLLVTRWQYDSVTIWQSDNMTEWQDGQSDKMTTFTF